MTVARCRRAPPLMAVRAPSDEALHAFGMSSSMSPGSNSFVMIALVLLGVKTHARPSRTPDFAIAVPLDP